MKEIRFRVQCLNKKEKSPLFGKDVIGTMLKTCCSELLNAVDMYVSDLLPSNFLYEPLSLDKIYVHTDDEYKMLKKIKKANYIETSVLESIAAGEDLIKKLMNGEIELKTEKICDVMSPEAEGIFDFYVSVKSEYQETLERLQTFSLGNVEFIVQDVDVKSVDTNKKLYVLQSKQKVTEQCMIHENTISMFRVIYDETTQSQYFKEGSIFEKRDNVLVVGTNEIQAYAYRIGGNSNA